MYCCVHHLFGLNSSFYLLFMACTGFPAELHFPSSAGPTISIRLREATGFPLALVGWRGVCQS